MSAWILILWAGAAAVVLFGLLYVIQRLTGDAGVVDVGWSFGVAATGIFFALMADGLPLRRLLLGAMIGLWGGRLGVYLLVDRVLGGEEDGRYQMLREKFHPREQWFFLGFFEMQALWVLMFAAPLLPAAYNGSPFGWTDILAVVVWLVAVGGESLADRQLARFRRRPDSRGKTCREGLWRYSRHPNYFFEWIHWFSYLLLAIGSPWWPAALAGPAVMLLFLYKLTGIPYTEKRALASRGDSYRRYQQTTSALIPWPPKEPAE